MKLSGISDKGFKRLARSIKGQSTEPDYGESKVEDMRRQFDAWVKNKLIKWTNEGWVAPNNLFLNERGLTRLPLIKSVGGDFNCSGNQLTSLEGAPQEVGGDFKCVNNSVSFTEEDIRAVSNVKGEIWNDEAYEEKQGVDPEDSNIEDTVDAIEEAGLFNDVIQAAINMKPDIIDSIAKQNNVEFDGEMINDVWNKVEGIIEAIGEYDLVWYIVETIGVDKAQDMLGV